MTDWQPIASAPRDETLVDLKTVGGFVLRARFSPDKFMGEDEEYVGGWEADEGEPHPDCWCDGVCWSSNSYGVPSDQPEFWRPVQSEPTQ